MTALFATEDRKPLRDYQASAIDRLRQSLRSGNRRAVLALATGAGKTRLAAELIDMAREKGNRAIFTVPAVALIDQTVDSFEAQGIEGIGVLQASHPRTDPTKPVQVASVQTLARRDIPPASLVIVDECFVAGTMVETARGQIPIERVSCTDHVLTACGYARVVGISQSQSHEIVRVEFSDGSHFDCTASHPVFTASGWVDAGALGDGSVVFGPEDVSCLWRGLCAEAARNERGGREGLECPDYLLSVLLEEAPKPDGRCRGEGSHVENLAANWAQAEEARRERMRDAQAAGGSGVGPRRGLGVGACGERLEGREDRGRSWPLQDRHSPSGPDGRDRSGRGKPRVGGQKGSGREKGCVPAPRRVVRVSRVECEGVRTVFNLQTGGHPSYFANGFLVHNCHIRSAVIERLMAERPGMVFVGLSATPWARGMGKHWQDLVIGATTADLIERGFLCPFRVFAAAHPDLTGIKTVAGDYHEGELAERMAEGSLVADVVTTWLEKGENRPTLCFAVNRAHAKQIHEQFTRAGVASAYVDMMTDRVERALIERRFRSGEVKVACSVRTLTTGVDWPVACIIDAAPTRSEMLHVQKIGRGLRVNPPWPDCIILDHSDNTIRLGFVTDIHRHALDKGERKEPVQTPRKEPLPKECGKCGFLKAPKTKVCPSCGHEAQPVAGVETLDGELHELRAKPRDVTMAEKQRWFSGLMWIALERGYKPGWAAQKFKTKFGVWPHHSLSATAAAPAPEVSSWVKAQQIRWAKGQAKKRNKGVAA